MELMKKFIIFKQGVLEELPLQLGVFPFGIIYGIMAIESGLTPTQAFLMSSIIFGGSKSNSICSTNIKCFSAWGYCNNS